MGANLFFMTHGSPAGPQLWKTDGTTSGTVLVKKLVPGEVTSSSPTNSLTVVGNELFFRGSTETLGSELWRSNGTTDGTSVVADLTPGALGSGPSRLTNVNGTLYFTATTYQLTTQTEEYGLYRLQSLSSFLIPVKLQTFDELPFELASVGGTLFFSVEGGLYKSDGTIAGTIKVKQVTEADTVLADLTNVSGTLFFTAPTQEGKAVWKSDGTSAGTVVLKDFVPGDDSLDPRGLYNGNGNLYFVTSTSQSESNLWKSDGTSAGTVPLPALLIYDFSVVHKFLNVGGTLYFAANSKQAISLNDTTLWRSNGTPSGTIEIKKTETASSSPTELTNVNGVMYFAADDGTQGRELWKSDGTVEGTELVRDIFPLASSDPSNLTNVNGTLYFTAVSFGTGNELWKSDGTSAGTVLVSDLRAGLAGSDPASLTNVDGRLYFTADNGIHGRELYTLGGRGGNTPVRVRDIRPGALGSEPTNLYNHNGQLFFTANDGTNGAELWKSSGTSATTVMVRNIRSGASGSYPNALMNVNGALYFVADDGVNGRELWKSDGTSAGTVLVKNIAPGAASSLPGNLTNVNGTLFFRALDSSSGTELWKSDGTDLGTVRVRDIVVGSAGSNPSGLTNVNGVLLFRATDSLGDTELWKSDGTAAGTVLVRNISTTGSSFPSDMVNLAGYLYFRAAGNAGAELWRSNGTFGGTTLVEDFLPGTQSGNPSSMALAGTQLFAVASTSTFGRELFTANLIAGSDANDYFTVRFSAPGPDATLTVLRTNARSSTVLGIFPAQDNFVLDGLGGTDTVRVEGTNSADLLIATGSSTPNSTIVNANGLEMRLARFETQTLAGGAGNDTYRIDGDLPIGALRLDESGGGIDTIDLTLTQDAVKLNLGVTTSQNVTEELSLQLTSASSFENAIVGSASFLTGNVLNNLLIGSDFVDSIDGGGGNDTINAGGGADLINGGDGNDTINGGEGNDLLLGGNGMDQLNGDAGNDTLNGGAGDDIASGGQGDDTYEFTAASTAESDSVIEQVGGGLDTLNFSDLTVNVTLQLGSTAVQSVHTNRTLLLNASDTFEVAVGGSGDDNLTGNALNNILHGRAGSDTLAGGQGDDTYVFQTPVATEADLVTEAANQGTDTLDFSALTTDVTLQLNSLAVQTVHTNRTLKLNAGSTFENAIGGSGNDILTGNGAANVLVGNNGNDQLFGLNGRDILIGGNGFDKLQGAGGEDILIAGRTLNDSVIANLNTIMAEWNSANDYATRIINLRAGVGVPPLSLQATVNVLDDAGELDELSGGLDNDWFFRDISDFISDLTGEVIDDI